MKCFIYRNLRRRYYPFSIKALEGPYKGKVVAYAPVLVLENVTFSVSQAGRQRVLDTGRKNVHAGIIGDLIGGKWVELRLPVEIQEIELEDPKTENIRYHPYTLPYFYREKSKEEVKSAKRVYIESGKVYAQ